MILAQVSLGEWFGILFGGGGLLFSVISLLWTRSLDGRTSQVKELSEKLDNLERSLDQKASALIEAKMEVLENRLMLPIQKLEVMLDQVQQRLNDGNEHFSDVDEKCHQLELKLETKINQVKSDVMAKMPGRI